jgi:23S rRNA (pseudouridine1915-N3)-methyltransferase
MFSEQLRNAFDIGQSKVMFVIGSSHGLGNEVYKRANLKLSFSKMTFPHQLFRVMLLEQIFRAFKIINNETYHK